VSSAVVETYFQLLSIDEKLAIARRAIASLTEMTGLERRRWKGGFGSELAYRQSLAALRAAEATVPSFEAAQRGTELALQLLVGRSPRDLRQPVPRGRLQLPEPPREVDSSLLLRRPDVASAEQLLIAA